MVYGIEIAIPYTVIWSILCQVGNLFAPGILPCFWFVGGMGVP